LESLSSTQVSRATKLLDEEFKNWRNRPLGEIVYLILNPKFGSWPLHFKVKTNNSGRFQLLRRGTWQVNCYFGISD